MADIVIQKPIPIKLEDSLTPDHFTKKVKVAVEKHKELDKVIVEIIDHPNYYMPVMKFNFYFIGYAVDTELCEGIVNGVIEEALGNLLSGDV